MKKIFCILPLLLAYYLNAQTTKGEVFSRIERTGGVHYAYPDMEIKPQTALPDGYAPFYISHLGRHGSRYLTSDDEYKNMLELFDLAKQNNALTPLGDDVRLRLIEVWKEVEWRAGDISNLGVKEQRGIAERMVANYPLVFNDKSKISACATTIVRCVLSMDFFCERIKELNPKLVIPRYSGLKWQNFLNHHTTEAIQYRSDSNTWRPAYKLFEKGHVLPSRMISSLFSKTHFLDEKMPPEKVMWDLFTIAGAMQNIDTKVTFYDLFTKQELFDLWQCRNFKIYVNDGNAALNGGIMMQNAKPLLKNILDSAEQVIKSGGTGADFRFAHDGNIIPLAMLLHLEGCYKSESNPMAFYSVWSDFKVAPMAGNIQMVFFKHMKTGDIIVKMLLNENEVLVPMVPSNIPPYYQWEDLQRFYKTLL